MTTPEQKKPLTFDGKLDETRLDPKTGMIVPDHLVDPTTSRIETHRYVLDAAQQALHQAHGLVYFAQRVGPFSEELHRILMDLTMIARRLDKVATLDVEEGKRALGEFHAHVRGSE